MLEAGEQHEVYSVREGVLDVGHFASSGVRRIDGRTLRVAARMAYADKRGDVVEDEVENLGELPRALRPADIDSSAGLMVDCPSLDVAGPLLDEFVTLDEPLGDDPTG